MKKQGGGKEKRIMFGEKSIFKKTKKNKNKDQQKTNKNVTAIIISDTLNVKKRNMERKAKIQQFCTTD